MSQSFNKVVRGLLIPSAAKMEGVVTEERDQTLLVNIVVTA